MIKNYIPFVFILFLFTLNIVKAQTTFVPDDNFEQALIDLGYDDVLDDYVLTSNISNVSELKVSYKNIKELTGIQDFENLQSLNCKNNQITNLDVSKNIQLQYLQCHYNQLYNIDVSKNLALKNLNYRNNNIQDINLNNNTKLEALNCLNNSISDLDLSKNIALTTLHCSYNDFTDLDLSKNNKLELLNFKKNDLVSLNVNNGANALITDFDATGNPDLECIIVDNADDANAGVSPYDSWIIDSTASFCADEEKTYVPDDNFERLLICMGYDDVLDDYVLTSNIDTVEVLAFQDPNTWQACPEFGPVIDLTGIEDFASLMLLDIYNNHRIEIIDFTKNIALTQIYLEDALDGVENFDLTKNIALEIINLVNTKIYGALDLSKNTGLREVNISDVPINKLNLKNGNNTNIVKGSCHLYRLHPDLTCIKVDDPEYSHDNWFQDTGVTFSEDCNYDGRTTIPDNNFEQALIDLGYDSILDGYVLTENISGILQLNIANKNIGDLTGIEDFSSLQILNCKNNQITNLDVRNNLELKTLYCHYNKIQTLNITENPELEILNCRNNQIQELDISENSKLEVLKCLNNSISDLDLSKNIALTTLYCGYNDITDLDLSKNNKLELLNCKKNQLVSLNVKNGGNAVLTTFSSVDNPSLTCIDVDKPNDANAGVPQYDNWIIDSTTTYCTDEDRTYVPDDNFEGYLISQGYDNVLDDYVLTANINTITEIKFCENVNDPPGDCEKWYFEIHDLTGIEDFESLVHFSLVNGGPLDHIDFSGNPNLESVLLDQTSFRSLNLSKNFKLDFLQVTLQSLPDVDLSNNLVLDYLLLAAVDISDLDLSKNINLTSVDIESCNSLQKLNLKNVNNTSLTWFSSTHNSSLSCIQVDTAVWSTANWTDIDPWTSFSEDCENAGFTYIPDNNFEQALIDLGHDDILDGLVLTSNISNISKLNVGSKNIDDLTGIQDFKSLRYLNCKDNHITNLDVSKNIQLVYLQCHYNQLYNIDVSKNLALENLNYRNNNVQDINLNNNAKLDALNCLNNSISDLDLSKNIALTTLHCSYNNISDLDLRKNNKLELLNCKKNDLVSLNVNNGANSLITDFNTIGNPELQCIEVDDAEWSIANWIQIDSWTGYSEDCSYNIQAKSALNNEDRVLSEAITLYPNPFTGILNIDPGLLKLRKVEVYTILGQKVKEVNSNLNTIELSELTNGVYMVRLYSKNGITLRKLIKK